MICHLDSISFLFVPYKINACLASLLIYTYVIIIILWRICYVVCFSAIDQLIFKTSNNNNVIQSVWVRIWSTNSFCGIELWTLHHKLFFALQNRVLQKSPNNPMLVMINWLGGAEWALMLKFDEILKQREKIIA